MADMAQVTNEELNTIIQQVSSPSTTNQEESTSNIQEEDQDEFANFIHHIYTKPSRRQIVLEEKNSNPHVHVSFLLLSIV